MANLSGSYDQNAQPSDFDQLEAGTYRAKIIESEIVDITDKADKGRCLKLTWQVETGPMDGRLTWQKISMWAKNMDNLDQVISIANSQFASVRQATGKVAPLDSSELHHIPCMITIGPQKKNPQYNEVKSVKAVAGAPASNAAPQQQQQRQAPQASQQQRAPANSGGGSAPWRRSA